MLYLVSAAFVILPFLLPAAAAPTAIGAPAPQFGQAYYYEKREEGPPPGERFHAEGPPPEHHEGPPPEAHFRPEGGEHRPRAMKREPEPKAESNVSLRPQKRWGSWGGGGCCGQRGW